MTTDDDRIAYLAGDAGAPVGPDERAALDDLRSLLADPAVWDDPDPALEDRVVAAVAAEAGPRPAGRRRRRVPWLPVLAAAAVAVVLGVVVLAGRSGGQAYRVALAGPGTTGTATLTRTPSGWRVELRAPALPRRDQGRYYEAYMVDGAGDRVSLGTFNDGRHVTLWAGVGPRSHPGFVVTAATAGGPPGPVVLTGRIPLAGD